AHPRGDVALHRRRRSAGDKLVHALRRHDHQAALRNWPMNLQNLEIGILFPAFLAGMLVLATHVPLGQQVLNRGIVFIDLAIAQVAGLGVTVADAMGFEPEGWRVQAAAVIAALVGALVLTWTEKKWLEV